MTQLHFQSLYHPCLDKYSKAQDIWLFIMWLLSEVKEWSAVMAT